MPIAREQLRLLPDDRADLLRGARTAHCATVDAGRPHVVPLWFVLVDGRIIVNSLRRSARGRHLRDGSPVSLCIDDGVEYGELRGLVLAGRFAPVTDAGRLDRAKQAFGDKYWHGVAVPDLRSHEWFELVEDAEVSWDFHRIGDAGRDRRLEALNSDERPAGDGSGA